MGRLRSPIGVAALVLLALVVLLAIFAPLLWGERAEVTDTANLLALPSKEHWIGTDQLGRDLLLRTLVATRLSLLLALGATVIAVVVGIILGTAPVLMGHRAGRLVIAVVNVAVAFPGLLLCLFFAAIFGVGQVGAVFAIGLAGAPSFARLCQTLAAGISKRDFVAAARIAGVGRWRLLIRHVLPNIAEPLIVNATIAAAGSLLSFAGLSFLGLGVQPPAYDWGRLMNEGLNRIYLNPAAALAPGLAVILAGLAFNLTGEAIAGVFRVATIAGLPSLFTTGIRQPAGEAVPEVRAVAAKPADDVVLSVRDLHVEFPGGSHPVRGISLQVRQGEALGIVGESGAGKSLTGMAIAGLIEAPGRVQAAELLFSGADLTDGADHRRLLGTSLALVFQDPMSSFNPVRRMGGQLAEVARVHQHLSRRQAFARAVEKLAAVRIPDPVQRAKQYPHEYSGGMRQRAMIGMGLMADPKLLIADEPTTALDVTVQQQVLDLIDSIRASNQVALILISHDVSLVRERCDRIVVMYAGRIVEELAAGSLDQALHPYTRLLLAAVPSLRLDVSRPLAVIPGYQPSATEESPGCVFAPRCPVAAERCFSAEPKLTAVSSGQVACWRPSVPLPATASDIPDEKPAPKREATLWARSALRM